MKQSKWTILSNEAIAWRTYKMVLQGDTAGMRPGQFVELALPAFYLRRPISVCDIEADRLTLIYKVVGEGTAAMAKMPAGMELDILTCLGNGYDLQQAGDEVLLVGGGVGVPPLVYAARQLIAMGKHVRVVMGFGSAREVFAEDVLKALGCQVDICTMDGTYGTKGVVTDLINTPAPYYYACGPLPMLKALVQKIGTNGQLSMEERMGCGVGICVGCSIHTTRGVKRVCKEGPVYSAEEVVF
ncbi:MAG: dihydroorotate dehydrogenase electron transfer subunit [Paludibacteraceae bacterium]|nr:dihydroorotate dehydrogenase electron transfer subunit [Paludibacteraceae bacterium]